MKLKDQVCSLELAKRLKELGVKQESEFIWALNEGGNYSLVFNDGSEDYVSAFNVAELGELLKKSNHALPRPFELWNYEWTFNISGQPEGYGTEADARAQMLVRLIEKGMVKT